MDRIAADQLIETRPMLTVGDLERLLKLHRRTIARLCASGKFPMPITVGTSRRWRAEDIDRLIVPIKAGSKWDVRCEHPNVVRDTSSRTFSKDDFRRK